MAQLSLSPSTLNLFQNCPRCFWRHVNRKVSRPRGPFPSLPGGMDRVLKAYFETYRGQDRLPPLLGGQLQGRLADVGCNFSYTDAALDATLTGKLDDVLAADGAMAPLDHKTRGSPPDGPGYTIQYYQAQMDCYTLLLERNDHRTTHQAHVVYYCPKPGALHEGVPFTATVHTIPTDPARAYQCLREAVACLRAPLPAASTTCEYCAWLKASAAMTA